MILHILVYTLSIIIFALSAAYFKLMFESVQVRSQKLCNQWKVQLLRGHIRGDIELFLRIEKDIERRGAPSSRAAKGLPVCAPGSIIDYGQTHGSAPTVLPQKTNESGVVNEP